MKMSLLLGGTSFGDFASLSPKGSAAFAPPNIGGVSEGRGGFAPPNIGGVSDGRGGFGALRIPHASISITSISTYNFILHQTKS
jgi:hypothetical protein